METNNQQICGLSRNRTLSCRIELLDSINYNVVDTLQGEITTGSITLTNNNSTSSASGSSGDDSDNSNFARISGSIEFILSSDLVIDYFKLDLKHLIRLIVIIKDNVSSISASYTLGICIINTPNIIRGIDGSNKISINLNDLMSNFNGDFSGELDHKVTIEASDTTSANLSQTIQGIATNADLMGLDISKVIFESNTYQILSEITCEVGGKVTDLLKSLMDLYKGYELFFNSDGILVYQKIKKYSTDYPIQEYNNSPNIISYSIKKDFTNVRNDIVVLGCTESDTSNNNVGKQYKGESTEENDNHPFSINNIGKRKKVISDEKQLTDDSCKSEADYWLDKYTNYAETLELNILQDFRLIPNRVIKVTYTDDNISINNKRYLINSVTFGLKPSDLSTVSCSLLYDNI